MKHLCMLLLMLVLSLGGWLQQPAALATPTSNQVHVYAYDDHHDPAATTDSATERGPPATCDLATTYDAIGLWPHGTSARPGGDVPGPTTTYDDPASLVRAALAATTMGRQVQVADGGLCALSGSRSAANSASKFGALAHSSSGIASYSSQRALTAGKGGSIQAHHLVEKRFADVMGGTTNDWATIVVTRSEHQVFTNAWRQAIPYGAGTRNATRADVQGAARQIYADYPEILKGLGLG